MRQETRVGLGRAWGMGTGTRASPSPHHQRVLGGNTGLDKGGGMGLDPTFISRLQGKDDCG